MKKIFYFGLIALVIYEILNVYFIMPMPGSQQMDTIELAYFFHSWRWVFRIVFCTMVIIGSKHVFRNKGKWLALVFLIITLAIVYLFNFKMKADKMFLQPKNVIFKSNKENILEGDRLVIGIENNGEYKAYPIEFLAYHHQILDTVGGKPVMITYCSVCRTGRVFEPLVKGNYEKFRLVGMNHFNAMFEDETTGSWWRQANGECIAGKLKGETLPELYSQQMTVDMWFSLYPNALVMQPDSSFAKIYDPQANYEKGKNQGSLTLTDFNSWNEKSWVVGIELENNCKAYDWNHLKAVRIINDSIRSTKIVLALSLDNQSFVVFENPSEAIFTINENNELISDNITYSFLGENLNSSSKGLKRIQAYQEFWHSWLTFHPNTEKYPNF